MARRDAYRVYLAGPISGCNDPQKRRWRDTVKRKYGSKMTFIDPVEMPVDREASPYGFVEADLRAIEEADGLLVNMWRESNGTAIGVAHAHLRSRTIVVCDPNHLDNSMFAFFADAVADTPLQGAKALWNLLRAERNWRVVKLGSRTERFERRKIMEAVRGAARSAGCDDITVPKLVLPNVINLLHRTDRKVSKSLTTTDINRVVVDVLSGLEGDAVYAESATGVLGAWRSRADGDRDSGTLKPAEGNGLPSPAGVQVPISCGSKSHGTI